MCFKKIHMSLGSTPFDPVLSEVHSYVEAQRLDDIFEPLICIDELRTSSHPLNSNKKCSFICIKALISQNSSVLFKEISPPHRIMFCHCCRVVLAFTYLTAQHVCVHQDVCAHPSV